MSVDRNRAPSWLGWLTVTLLLLISTTRAPVLTGAAPGAPFAMPLRFEPNVGQADPSVRFLARSGEVTVLLDPHGGVALRAQGQPAARLSFLGSTGADRLTGQRSTGGKANYYLGNDASRWQHGIPLYSAVQARNVYPDIDVIYYGGRPGSGESRQLEYDLVVQPGGDPGRIRMALDTAQPGALGPDGAYRASSAAGQITLGCPVIYQEIDGVRRAVSGAFQLVRSSRPGLACLAFNIGAYDRTRALVIDPVFGYSTYLGGTSGGNASGNDDGNGIAVDAGGRAHVAGRAESVNFPTRNAANSSLNNGPASSHRRDGFVTKLTADGSDIVFSTYVGGSDLDVAFSVTLDSAGNVYAAGRTASTNFPTTRGALQEADPDGTTALDGILVKLSPTGTLLYSTFVGGSNYDICHGIGAVDDRDSSGNLIGSHVLITGETRSSNFPRRNAYQPGFAGGAIDTFVLSLNPDASDSTVGPTDPGDLLYGTYLGGSRDDSGYGLRVDNENRAVVTGITTSNDHPVTHDALDAGLSGLSDAFVVCVDPRLAGAASLAYSSYLGGSGAEIGYGIDVGGDGHLYVAGESSSTDFPTTAGAFDRVLNGLSDAFVVRLDRTQPAATQLRYGTLLGGGGTDWARQMVVQSGGEAVVAGGTQSANLPLVEPLQSDQSGQDGWMARLNPAGSALLFSTYFGGSGMDEARSVDLDPLGNAYLTGETSSSNLPTTVGAFDRTFGAPGDGWVAKVVLPAAGYAVGVSPGTVAPGGTVRVTWSAPPGRPADDRISLFASGAPNTSPLSSHTTGGATSGAFDLTAPTTPGQYELRYLLAGSNTDTARSGPFTVQAPPADGPLAFRSATSGNNGAGTSSLNLAVPSGTASGDLLIASVVVGSTGVGLTPPAGWTAVINASESTVIRTVVYRRLAGGAEPASYTWSFSGSVRAVGALLGYRGASSTLPIEAADGYGNVASQSITSPGITTTTPGALLLQVASTAVATTINPASGMTERTEAAGTGLTVSVSEQPRPAAGATGTRKAQAGAAARNVGHSLALCPSSTP